ncbi:MAG TPA: citryl-CoA lyase [Thermoleophilaceae bacterium]|nr:citryl-CoA lyase [Thermoleophilaceae bacterium]
MSTHPNKPPRSGKPLAVTRGSAIEVRGHDVATQLIGQVSLTELLLLELHGELQSPQHVRVVDGILVAMAEHGITPSTLAARLVLDGAPESLQGAVAAGLLAAGSRYLGAIEEAAYLLQEIVADAGDGELGEVAERVVRRLGAEGTRVPGVGHNLHADSDSRVTALVALAEREGVAGPHLQALDALHAAATSVLGKDLILNAAGAVAALLSDLDYRPEDVRGFALVARSAGLFAHVVDERRHPVARGVWERLHETDGTAA